MVFGSCLPSACLTAVLPLWGAPAEGWGTWQAPAPRWALNPEFPLSWPGSIPGGSLAEVLEEKLLGFPLCHV